MHCHGNNFGSGGKFPILFSYPQKRNRTILTKSDLQMHIPYKLRVSKYALINSNILCDIIFTYNSFFVSPLSVHDFFLSEFYVHYILHSESVEHRLNFSIILVNGVDMLGTICSILYMLRHNLLQLIMV